MTNRYASWADVLDYCRRSANPVGRLVLCIAGYRDQALDRSSDALCTALQLTNFWQDFGRDWRAGRLYVPREVCAETGADEADLAGGVDRRRLGPGARTLRRASRAICSARAARSATASAAACARSCGSPGWAACGSSSASNTAGCRCSITARPSAPPTCRCFSGARRAGRRRGCNGAENQLLLLVSRPAGRAAAGDRGRLGLLPGRGRCRG